MELLRKKPYVTADMIELSDGLRLVIAEMVDENVRCVIEANYAGHHALFDNEDEPGLIDVFLDTECEISVSLSLREIVKTTLAVRDSQTLLAGLAAELESLAALVRKA